MTVTVEEEVKKTTIVPVQSIVKQSAKAIKALQDFQKKQSVGEKVANKSEDYVHLVISLKKIAERASVKPYRLSLPHPFRRVEDKNSLSVCLIVKDPLEGERTKLPTDIPCIQYVESVKGLANKNKPFEAKRILCASHDLFLADERVLPCLPKILGKVFFDKKKQPIPVDLTVKNVRGELESAIQATYLHLNTGPCITVKVGKSGQPVSELQANIEAIIKQVDKRVPEGGLSNVRAMSLKTGCSIALPIFETAPSS
jgi:ribosome biogenesis protein UTP30